MGSVVLVAVGVVVGVLLRRRRPRPVTPPVVSSPFGPEEWAEVYGTEGVRVYPREWMDKP